MRIIGGKYRGRKLLDIEIKGVRPTSDRVREAVFNILQTKICGSSFLDLFSGSGAIGIEAISRGADKVFLCDTDTQMLERNLEKFAEMPVVLKCSYIEALSIAQRTEKYFDIIYIDPPYRSDFGQLALDKIREYSLVLSGGYVIIEGDKPMENCDNVRKYGSTFINIFRGA